LLYPNALWLIARDVEEISKIAGTITCSKNPVAFKDGEYLPRVPPMRIMKWSDVLSVMSCPVVSITTAVIWRDAPSVIRGLYLVDV
jgi:hypothetical protein